jgi:hypothetical protein
VRNWELGIGNWELAKQGIGETGNSGLGIGHELSSKKVKLKITHFIFLLLHYQFPITNAQCPIPDYPLPNLSCRTAASVWLTKS